MIPIDPFFANPSNSSYRAIEYCRSTWVNNLHLRMNMHRQNNFNVQTDFHALFAKLIGCFTYLYVIVKMWTWTQCGIEYKILASRHLIWIMKCETAIIWFLGVLESAPLASQTAFLPPFPLFTMRRKKHIAQWISWLNDRASHDNSNDMIDFCQSICVLIIQMCLAQQKYTCVHCAHTMYNTLCIFICICMRKKYIHKERDEVMEREWKRRNWKCLGLFMCALMCVSTTVKGWAADSNKMV